MSWTLHNLLSERVSIYRVANDALLTTVDSLSEISISHLRNGEELRFVSKSLDARYFVKSAYPTILIGTVVYSYTGRDHIALHGDVAGVNLINRLRAYVDVYHVPLKFPYARYHLARLGPRDDLGYLGGSGATIYLDNGGNGFFIGDQLIFSYQGGNDVTVTLHDNFIDNIYIGVVGEEAPEPLRDGFIYRTTLSHLASERLMKHPRVRYLGVNDKWDS